MATVLADVRAAIEAAYPPRLAEPWDTGIGLTCGDPTQPVERVLLAVDVDPITVAEAHEQRADVLLTHHPMLFKPVQSVAADTDKGSLIHPLIRSGIAHFAAHTNADRAAGGVNDALAEALGLVDTVPLVPVAPEPLAKLVVFVPQPDADRLIDVLADAGAGRIGDYEGAAFTSPGEGRFTPLSGAHPAIGAVGTPERVAETRVEMVLPPARCADVVAALRTAHPYEEPAFDLYRMAPVDPAGGATEGLGRVGTLSPGMTLSAFTAHVAAALPETVGGVRAAGDPDREISRVAVCGGAGAGELGAATRAGAEVYVTSDLSHHTVAEHVANPERPAVVEVAHWAGEWPWLARAAAVIDEAFSGAVITRVSTRRTDAWSVHAPSPGARGLSSR